MDETTSVDHDLPKHSEHPEPHPERLQGGKARQSAPYPKELVAKLVEGVVSELQNFGTITSPDATGSFRIYLDSLDISAGDQAFSVAFEGVFEAWVKAGQARVYQIRHGHQIADATAEFKDEALAAPGAEPSAPDNSPIEFEQIIATSPVQFERIELKKLQRNDPEFADIILAHEVLRKAEQKHEGQSVTDDILFEELKKHIIGPGKQRSKRADVALKTYGHYSMADGILYRRLPEMGGVVVWLLMAVVEHSCSMVVVAVCLFASLCYCYITTRKAWAHIPA